MVLAYHIIITTYGFWLPNDPRGSWSDFVWSWELARFGPATKVTTRASVAGVPHDYELRQAAKAALLRPSVKFTNTQIEQVANGFADAAGTGAYQIPACAILPEHVHMVVRRHPQRDIEMIASHLKSRASTFLAKAGLHPFQVEMGRRGVRPSPWGESFWQVYLDSGADIERAVKYVQNNPAKEGRPEQRWSFVGTETTPAQGPGLNGNR